MQPAMVMVEATRIRVDGVNSEGGVCCISILEG
jgi:hypothetical protein